MFPEKLNRKGKSYPEGGRSHAMSWGAKEIVERELKLAFLSACILTMGAMESAQAPDPLCLCYEGLYTPQMVSTFLKLLCFCYLSQQ